MEQAPAAAKRQNSSIDQLIDATAALLGERTAIEVSLQEISKKAGLNSALVKYYFGNKEGLLLAVLKRDAATQMNALARLVEMPVDAEQKLRIHIGGIINAYYRSPYLNRLIHYMIESANAEAAQQVVEIFIEPMLAAYRAIIEQGIREGTFQPVEPAFLYYSLVGSCDHIFHAAYSVQTTLGMTGMTEELKQRYTAHVTSMCLNGLLAQPSATTAG